MKVSAKLREKAAAKVTVICMAGNVLLTALKLLAGIIGNSAAMVADAIHSLSDFFTDIVLLIGVKISNKPADKDHPYGHGRMETFTSLIIAVVLGLVAYGIFSGGFKSVMHVLRGGVLEKPGYIALIMAALSIAAKEFMYQYTAAVGKRIDSSAIISNAWHHRSDAFSSLATLAGISGAIFLGEKWVILDPVTAMLVSLFIFSIAFKIGKNAVNEMLDISLPEEKLEKIKSITLSVEGCSGAHSIKTRKIGYIVSIAMHIEFDQNMKLKEVHEKMTAIENKLRKHFGEETFISIHPEPAP